jgi:hypothetical protein
MQVLVTNADFETNPSRVSVELNYASKQKSFNILVNVEIDQYNPKRTDYLKSRKPYRILGTRH